MRGEIETQRVHARRGARRGAGVRARSRTGGAAAVADRRRSARAGPSRKESAASQIATLEQRVEEAKTERASLNDAPAAFAEKRTALISEIETAEAARRAAADQLAEAENALAAADKDARAALEAVGAAREDAARAEERFAGANRRLADIEHEIREMLEIEPVAVAELAEIKPGAELPDVADVEAKLDRIRRERERLGAVNLRAEEELREVETQHGNLTKERDDLVEAIKRFRQGIQNLNREARERLLASFEVVNAHFKKLFSELFGGGTAELQLVEADDPLEAGLEIIAKPPGKKPATLSLLSGGEQALTALALIFAVFLTNPAPICVLDEVDAPLDDHNIERFCDLLDDDDALDRHPLRDHHPQPDHDGAHEPAVRRHHGRARRVAARVGRPRRRGEAARGELTALLADDGLRPGDQVCWHRIGLSDLACDLCAGHRRDGEIGFRGLDAETRDRRPSHRKRDVAPSPAPAARRRQP